MAADKEGETQHLTAAASMAEEGFGETGEAKHHGSHHKTSITQILSKIWRQAATVFLVFVSTFAVFPGEIYLTSYKGEFGGAYNYRTVSPVEVFIIRIIVFCIQSQIVTEKPKVLTGYSMFCVCIFLSGRLCLDVFERMVADYSCVHFQCFRYVRPRASGVFGG